MVYVQPTLTWETTLQRVGLAIEGQADQSITANSHKMMAGWLPPNVRQLSVSRPRKPFFSESGVEVFDSVYKKYVPSSLSIVSSSFKFFLATLPLSHAAGNN